MLIKTNVFYLQLTSVPFYDIIYSTNNTPFNTAVKVERAVISNGDNSVAVTDTFTL